MDAGAVAGSRSTLVAIRFIIDTASTGNWPDALSPKHDRVGAVVDSGRHVRNFGRVGKGR
jgi:hypothetical protein